MVLRVCRAVLGDLDAEDAWSETFLAALRAYPNLRPGSDLRAWLVTVAHHKAIDVFRSRARRAVPVEVVPEPLGTHATHDAAVMADDELASALAALTLTQRTVVAYRYLADLSYRDIAVLLETSEGAARQRASGAIAALRRAYPNADANTGTVRTTEWERR